LHRLVKGLFTQSDCVVLQKGWILSVKIVSYHAFRCRMIQFSLISVGLCKYPYKLVFKSKVLPNIYVPTVDSF
jgi:hypothetical protein